MSRQLLSVSLVLAMTVLPASRGWSMSLEEAQHRMLAHSSQAKAKQWEVDRWQEQQRAVRWLAAPRIEATAAVLAYEKDLSGYRDSFAQQMPESAGPAMATNPVFTGSGIHQQQGVRSQVSMQVPLYTGGRIQATQSQAGWRYQQARAEQQWHGQTLERELIEAYFNAQLAQQAVVIRAEALSVLEQHLHRARRLQDEGMVSTLQAMQAQVARDQAHRQWRQAQRDAQDAMAALAHLTGGAQAQCLATPLQWHRLPLVDEPIAEHPALLALAAVGQQARAQVRVEQSHWKPEVLGFASVELNRDMAPIHEPDWAVGLGVRWQLTTGINRQAMVRASYAQQAQAEATADHQSQQLALMADVALGRYQFSLEQKAVLANERAFAVEHARLQQAAFEQGQATVLDVNDAVLQVSVVELESLQLMHQHLLALADWLWAEGQISVFFEQLPQPTQTPSCQESLQ